MADDGNTINVESLTPAPEGLVKLTHIIYGLHTLSVLIGLTSVATIVGSFVFGLPSIVAVILNYVKRSDAKGTWLESHFSWQIRTFWFAFLASVLIGLLILTIIGIPLAFIGLMAVGVWVIYRVGRGWLALNDGKAIAP